RDGVPITIPSPPPDYIRIVSGLGDAVPGVIVLMPANRAETLRGVLELASFPPKDERQAALLDELMPLLAANTEILERSLHTEALLKETQEQAARMEAQAVRLEQQSHEMTAQQAALASTDRWYRSIIASAPDGALVVD